MGPCIHGTHLRSQSCARRSPSLAASRAYRTCAKDEVPLSSWAHKRLKALGDKAQGTTWRFPHHADCGFCCARPGVCHTPPYASTTAAVTAFVNKS
jgi:hypothetical protein